MTHTASPLDSLIARLKRDVSNLDALAAKYDDEGDHASSDRLHAKASGVRLAIQKIQEMPRG